MTTMQATAVAPANIAFIKYWGVQDAARTLPYNGSISMKSRHMPDHHNCRL